MTSTRPSAPAQRLTASRDILATLRSRSQQSGRVAVTHVRREVAAQATGTDPVVASSRPARVAVVASKRVGSAVRRNRAKRLLREAARRVNWAPDVDVVLVARAATATSPLQDVAAEVALHAVSLGVTAEFARVDA